MESVECGAAALGMILGYHGRWVPLSELRWECGVSRDGSKATHLLQAARRHGLLASGVRCGIEGLEQIPLPAILFWDFNHFVVLEGWGKNFYLINDPACGRRRVGEEEFGRCFTGVALRMEPGENFEMRPAVSPVRKTLESWMWGPGAPGGFLALTALLIAVPPLAMAGLMRLFVDEFLIGGGSRWVLTVVSAVLGFLGMQWALIRVQTGVFSRWQASLAQSESSEKLVRLLEAPLSWYANRNGEEVAERSLLPLDSIRRFSVHLAPAAWNLIPSAACVALMAFWDGRMASITLLLFAVCSLLSFLHEKRRGEDDRQLAHLRGRFSFTARHGLSVMDHLKCGSGDAFLKRLGTLGIRIRELHQRIEGSDQVSTLTSWLPAATGGILLLTWGSLQTMQQETTVGTMAGIFVLWLQLLVLMKPWFAVPAHLARIKRDLERLQDVPGSGPLGLDEESMTSTRSTSHAEGSKGSGEFESLDVVELSFCYTKFSGLVVSDVSFQVLPGQVVVITGPSGCGKSTLLALTLGLLKPNAGGVLLNGRAVTPASIARCAGVVGQDLHFFRETVSRHLRLGNERACLDVPIRAAGLEELLAERGDIELAEDGNVFSGGQRQRLEIARVLAREAGLQVLDEAFSGLDADSAETLLLEFRKRKCAVLLVTHRLELMRMADQILLMEAGQIVDRGNFDELSLRNPGFGILVGAGQ